MNQVASDFIKQHEGCRLAAYQDAGNIWTIGWGSTGPDIKQGVTWTQEQADFRLEIDITKTETAINKILTRKLSAKSIAALVSFAYNLGEAALASSHMFSCVQNGDDLGAAKAFLSWDHVGQTEVKGLLIRRLEEAAIYLRGL